MKKPRTIIDHIAEEGFCCIWGYTALCRARGETIASMARFARLPRETVRDHVRRGEKKAACLGRDGCLKEAIRLIKLDAPKKKG